MNLRLIPFTYMWILDKSIGGDVKTVLDLGCGEGDLMREVSRGKQWEIYGVELFKKAGRKAKKSGVYKDVFIGSVTDLPKSILKNKYDIVFCSQVLEHLVKNNGKEAIKTWEKLARKKIVITTPVGYMEYDPIVEKEIDDNPLQKHLSGWLPKELDKLGYKVRGQGARFIYGEEGLAKKLPFLYPVLGLISLLLSPILYVYPNLATYMIASKKV